MSIKPIQIQLFHCKKWNGPLTSDQSKKLIFRSEMLGYLIAKALRRAVEEEVANDPNWSPASFLHTPLGTFFMILAFWVGSGFVLNKEPLQVSLMFVGFYILLILLASLFTRTWVMFVVGLLFGAPCLLFWYIFTFMP